MNSAANSAAPEFVSEYTGDEMNRPVVSLDEDIRRVVGRRTKTPDGLSLAASNEASAALWRKTFGGVRVPKGVYRFSTHQEADEWLWRKISRPTS